MKSPDYSDTILLCSTIVVLHRVDIVADTAHQLFLAVELLSKY